MSKSNDEFIQQLQDYVKLEQYEDFYNSIQRYLLQMEKITNPFKKILLKISQSNSQSFNKFIEGSKNQISGLNLSVFYVIGICDLKGIGVKQDPRKGYEEINKINDTFLTSKVIIAKCNEKGLGTPKNVKEAFQIYSQLFHTHNFEYLSFKLAKCFEDGIGTPKDQNQANKFYDKAISLNDTKAIKSIVESKNDPVTIVMFLRIGVQLQNPTAMYLLAVYLDSHKNHLNNPNESVWLLMDAIRQGNAEAATYLVNHLKKNFGNTSFNIDSYFD